MRFDIIIVMIYLYSCDISALTAEYFSPENLCESRKEYVDEFTDQKRKNQSVAVWKLLSYVLKTRFKLDGADGFCKDGKWGVRRFDGDFSLTHSDNFVLVAISADGVAVGADCEKIDGKILKLLGKNYFSDKICDEVSDEEKAVLLTKKWAEKESAFKSGLKSGIKYTHFFETDSLGAKYVFTVASGENEEVVYEKADGRNIKLGEI